MSRGKIAGIVFLAVATLAFFTGAQVAVWIFCLVAGIGFLIWG